LLRLRLVCWWFVDPVTPRDGRRRLPPSAWRGTADLYAYDRALPGFYCFFSRCRRRLSLLQTSCSGRWLIFAYSCCAFFAGRTRAILRTASPSGWAFGCVRRYSTVVLRHFATSKLTSFTPRTTHAAVYAHAGSSHYFLPAVLPYVLMRLVYFVAAATRCRAGFARSLLRTLQHAQRGCVVTLRTDSAYATTYALLLRFRPSGLHA